MKLQSIIMKELNTRNKIIPRSEIRTRVEFLKDYLIRSSMNGFVLGISGGQDSTLAGRLCQMAVGELREEGLDKQFIAVRLPYGTQKDEEDAQLALSFIQPDKVKTFNIKSSVDSFEEEYNKTSLPQSLTDFHKGNAKARMRMIAQYAIGGENSLLVVGTDHAAEAVTGFFTKYGDGGADILPLSGSTKRQGMALLKELNAPESLYLKKPTADLLDNRPGQEDETELGITYDQIDDYLEGKEVPDSVAEAIEKRYQMTEHKRQLPASLFDAWWK